MPRAWRKFDPATPKGAVYVGRAIGEEGRWGNPYTHKPGTSAPFIVESRDAAVAAFKAFIHTRLDLIALAKRDLRGRDLVCWCAPSGGIEFDDPHQICHAQVLGIIANS